uniref:Rab-GAP TBC domain-containing protein n=1 Tax=Plectus sambesii TaxID=2011161 RepID=A0A914UIN1_9BILA
MLLVLGRPAALRMSTQLAASASFRRYLTEPLEQSAIKDIELVYVILANTDTDLEYYMRRAELGQLFALSWLLTWFAHSIDKYDSVVRLYDFFLASHSLMPVYLSAALVLYRSSEILDKCECDMAQIHSLLSKLPRQMPLEALIADAQDLYLQFPPSRLRGDLLRAYEEQVVLDRRLDRQKPSALLRMGGRRPPPGVNRHAFQMIFWAGTASAAAWYFLSNYGVREMSWMQFT